MKDDTISRAAAISKVKKLCEGCYLSEHCGKCLTKCLVRKAVKILEKVLPAQRGWIPCKTALPKTEEKVLITCEHLDIYGKPHRYVCKAFHVDRYTMRSDVDWWDEGCDEYREEDDQYYVLEGWYEYIHNWGNYSSVRITEDKVVAWMPLPTPYREGGQT